MVSIMTSPRRQSCRLLLHILAGFLVSQIQICYSFAVPDIQNHRFRPQSSRGSNEYKNRDSGRRYFNYDQNVNDFDDFDYAVDKDYQSSHLKNDFDPFSILENPSEEWDDFKLLLLVGRRKRPGRKNTIEARTFEKSRPYYKEGRIHDHLSRLAIPRSPVRQKSSVENLHTFAGPPYKDQVHKPNVTFVAYKAYPATSLNSDGNARTEKNWRNKQQQRLPNSREDFVSSIQHFPEFLDSSIRKRTPTQGRAFEKDRITPIVREGILLNKPHRLTSNRLARRDKFKEAPPYTFNLADGVHRNYKRFNPVAKNSKRQTRHGFKDSRYFLATVGYPNNHWKRIEKQDLDYYT